MTLRRCPSALPIQLPVQEGVKSPVGGDEMAPTVSEQSTASPEQPLCTLVTPQVCPPIVCHPRSSKSFSFVCLVTSLQNYCSLLRYYIRSSSNCFFELLVTECLPCALHVLDCCSFPLPACLSSDLFAGPKAEHLGGQRENKWFSSSLGDLSRFPILSLTCC